MNYKIRNLILFSVILLSGCATNGGGGAGGILVDTKGKDSAQYALDNQECQRYAESQSVGNSAASGAAGGALFGLLIGAVVDRDNIGKYAAAGGVGGLAGGASRGVRNKDDIFRNCMRGRGYTVLN